ncbi:UPF0481 protein At3g47200-like [Euphorbia lathyris]|uniref:UPF0481 protein At3g47200-like n=1 Tax=Euphorbia lathyris TaxID=212925 RepID=UPI003313BC71
MAADATLQIEEITENDNWVTEVNKKLQKLVETSSEKDEDSWTKRSIYKIPSRVSDSNEKAYKPQVVSFGPYHYGENRVKAMEEHKHRALVQFLSRTNVPVVELVQGFLAEEIRDLKESYDMIDKCWEEDTSKFVQLMILDGCFMLEIFGFCAVTLHGGDGSSGYSPNDPIFSKHGKLYMIPHIKHDMLLLENQLPMLVLEKLFAFQLQNTQTHHQDEEYLNNLILRFFFPNNTSLPKLGKCLHILDMYRKNLVQEDPHKKIKRKPTRLFGTFRMNSDDILRSATHLMQTIQQKQKGLHKGGEDIIKSARELNEAGIEFKKSRNTSLQGISFQAGILELPVIIVDETTETIFLNMIAFERFHVSASNEITSYIFFMDNIINNEKDVLLLHSKGIIKNSIGSNKAVAKLFNSLSKDITFDPAESNLNSVHKNVSAYCQKSWNQWRANLIQTYFRNPWAFLSLFAGVILFILTIAQTVFSVYTPNFGKDSSASRPAPRPRT